MRRFSIFLTSSFLALALAGPMPARAETPPQQLTRAELNSIPFVSKTVTTETGTYPCQVFVPKKWNKRKSWPVILFLHGSGERGSDGLAQTKNGIRRLIGQDPDGFPCVVVCPQCPAGDRWWPAPDMMAVANKAVDDAVAEYNGDKRRIYLTGLSLGGYGTWALARLMPGKWAAIAPVCGGVADLKRVDREKALGIPSPDFYHETADKITRIPVWVFHGSADRTVPVSESRQMAAVLLSLKADVRYSEYPGVGHNSWDKAYAEPGFLSWLLSHRLDEEPIP